MLNRILDRYLGEYLILYTFIVDVLVWASHCRDNTHHYMGVPIYFPMFGIRFPDGNSLIMIKRKLKLINYFFIQLHVDGEIIFRAFLQIIFMNPIRNVRRYVFIMTSKEFLTFTREADNIDFLLVGNAVMFLKITLTRSTRASV